MALNFTISTLKRLSTPWNRWKWYTCANIKIWFFKWEDYPVESRMKSFTINKRCWEHFMWSVTLKTPYVSPMISKKSAFSLMVLVCLSITDLSESSPNPKPIVNGKPARISEWKQRVNFVCWVSFSRSFHVHGSIWNASRRFGNLYGLLRWKPYYAKFNVFMGR